MKFYEFITVIIIFFVLLAILLIGGRINNINNLQSVYSSENIEKNETDGVVLNIDDDDIQKIYPFNGAYPTNELAYLSKLKNVDKENMTNDFVLRTAFAKVKKEDWADTYKGEGNPVKIDAKILEGYVKDIFGNIEVEHKDFSNKDLSIDGATTMLYENQYNAKDNTYTINLEPGDGLGDSYVDEFKTTVTRYGDRIEIVINPIYLDNIGQKKNKDGEFSFFYEIYSSYNFKTQKFENKLTDEIENSIYEMSDDGTLELVDEVKMISESDLEKYTITYRLNGKTNKFEFQGLKFEE